MWVISLCNIQVSPAALSFWTKSTTDIDIGLYSISMHLPLWGWARPSCMPASNMQQTNHNPFNQSRKELVASNVCYWADTLPCKNLLIPQESHLSTEHFRRVWKIQQRVTNASLTAAAVQRKLWIYSEDAAFLCGLFSVLINLIDTDVLLNEVCATKYLVDAVPL